LIRFLRDEAGADQVQRIVEGEEPVLLPFMTIMEVNYVLRRTLSAPEVEHAMAALREWPVTIAESSPEWGRRAAELKSRGGLSVADAWIASLALLSDAELVHKDPEFDAVEGLRSHRLPD
jgi:predicted nucleic acid-binding protein